MALQEETTAPNPTVTLIDAFLITLACANELRLELTDEVPKAPALNRPILRSLTICAGMMATALEKRDHLEEHTYRQTIVDALLPVTRQLLVEHERLGIDTATAVPARWHQIESKLPLRQMFRADLIETTKPTKLDS